MSLEGQLLSDNVRHIGDSWEIGRGRYAGIGLMNQRLLSISGDEERAIAIQHALGIKLGVGNA